MSLRARRRIAALAIVAATCVVPLRARADELPPPPPTSNSELSQYEKETLRLGLARFDETVEPDPETKPIERIDIVNLDVFEERDVMPESAESRPWLKTSIVKGRAIANAIHFTSRDFTIRREMLFLVNDPYKGVLVEETARNLRSLSQLSAVVIVPVKSKTDPSKVRVLVITKDVWSLRLNWNLAFGNGKIQQLTFQPQERNLFGLHHTANTFFDLLPLSYTLGAGYNIPRFGTSRIGAGVAANVIMNRPTGQPEGTSFSGSVGQPLYSAHTEWSWALSGSYTNAVTRRYVNGELGGFDSPSTKAVDNIPFEYRSQTASQGASATRSFGWTNKFDVTFGFGVSQDSFKTVDDLSKYDAAAVKDFLNLIPIGETRVGPSVTFNSYTTKFHAMHDLGSLALEEDYRLGHNMVVKLYRASKEIGSTRDIAGAYGGFQYTVPVGDGIARASVEGTAEQEMNKGEERISDASIAAAFRFATPRFRFGRFVVDTSVLDRERNYLNSQSFLGGSGRLRGYPTSYYFGKDVYVSNLEFRSRPISILTAQVGGVLFHDMGDAFKDFDTLRLKHSIGGGVRILFPELDRAVFRVDVAAPLTVPDPGKNDYSACMPAGVPCKKLDPVTYFFTFGQAFDFASL
jgi:hypothetical protein